MHKRSRNFSQERGLKITKIPSKVGLNFHVKILFSLFFRFGKIVVLIGIDFAGVESM